MQFRDKGLCVRHLDYRNYGQTRAKVRRVYILAHIVCMPKNRKWVFIAHDQAEYIWQLSIVMLYIHIHVKDE